MQITELPDIFAIKTLRLLHKTAPLVHCITNDVVQNITANTLLALGAIPFMVIEPNEAKQFSTIANALLINIGTLCRQRAKAMLAAISSANQNNIPWILDPVGIGALNYRNDFTLRVLTMKPTVIRCNIMEILALSNFKSSNKHDINKNFIEIVSIAQDMAQYHNAIIVVTGKIDIITNNKITWQVNDGHELMTKVIGTGCILSAVIAACCTLPGDIINHVASACRLIARTGKLAARTALGPGSLFTGMLDKLYQLKDEDLK